MTKFTKMFVLVMFLCSSSLFSAENDLKVFGFFQGRLSTSNVKTDFPGFPTKNSFDLQQMNLMASNNFGDGFSAFVNLEFQSTYNTKEQWGSLNIQEAFAKYENSDGTLKFKAGLFLPQFNNMLEIANRTPLLPYIYRPLVYETQVGNIIDFDNFLPQKANFQVYGSYGLSDNLKIDYAVYTGNLSNNFIDKTDPSQGQIGASNQSTALTYGGRIGISMTSSSAGSLKLGASYVIDKDKSKTINKVTGNLVPLYDGLINAGRLIQSADTAVFQKDLATSITTGDLKRAKMGIDFKYEIKSFTLTAELMTTTYSDVSEIEKTLDSYGEPLDKVNSFIEAFPDSSVKATFKSSIPSFLKTGRSTGSAFDKTFLFATLQYDFDDLLNENIYLYVSYSKIVDKMAIFMVDGIEGQTIGAGWKVIPQTVIKGQYNHFHLDSKSGAYKENTVMLAVSVMF